jgi:hypothetical protein
LIRNSSGDENASFGIMRYCGAAADPAKPRRNPALDYSRFCTMV